MDAVAGRLEGALKARVERAFPLARLTTYRLGGPAGLFVEPATLEDVEVVAQALAAEGVGPQDVLLLGRGSNVVVSDEGFDGAVIHLGASFSWIEDAGGGLDAGASTPLPMISNWAARRGLSGAEFAIAIPGSVGGAVRMNAGAHGADMSGCLSSVQIYDLEDLRLRDVDVSELGLGYRRSALDERHLVLRARLRLAEDDPAAVRQRVDSYRHHRATTQPGAVQNAGSVFRNPPGDSAGRLVEATGLKGFAVGEARVSELHANFFIAGDGASAQDVYELVRTVRRLVAERSGVELEPEVRFVGRFEERDRAVVTR